MSNGKLQPITQKNENLTNEPESGFNDNIAFSCYKRTNATIFLKNSLIFFKVLYDKKYLIRKY